MRRGRIACDRSVGGKSEGRACFAAPADFVVRQGPHGATLFGLCSKCCKSPRVRSLLKGEALCLDLIGVSGKHSDLAKG